MTMRTRLPGSAGNLHLTPDVVRSCVEAACSAPSVHNSQPWRWTCRAGSIALFPDATRLLRMDSQGRQLVISCGAALHHLVTALLVEGCASSIERFPLDGADAPIARVAVTSLHRPDARDIALRRAIDCRHSDRRPFRRASLRGLLDSLVPECHANGVSLIHLDGDAHAVIADAAAASAALHRYDSVYQHEIRWWAGHDRPYDGIPLSLLPDLAASQAVSGSDFPTGSLPPARAGTDEADWLLLATATDSPEAWLRSGEALSLLLLSATAMQLATCTVTHVIQDPDSRELLRHALPATSARVSLHPQILVRIGAPEFPPLPRETSRRPVDDVLHFEKDRE